MSGKYHLVHQMLNAKKIIFPFIYPTTRECIVPIHILETVHAVSTQDDLCKRSVGNSVICSLSIDNSFETNHA